MKKMFGLTALLGLMTFNAFAARWFEVEFIVFEQKPNSELREDFSLKSPEIKGKNQKDLLTNGFQLNGQNRCLAGKLTPQIEKPIDFFEKQSTLCPQDYDYLSHFDELPVSPSAEVQEHTDYIYLLDETQLQLRDTLTKLKRKGLKPVLHTGWRFPEQSQARAPNMIVYGGKRFPGKNSVEAIKNFINSNNFAGLVKPEFDFISNKEPDLWQLQGLMKIHVRHYLFITSEFDFRYLNEENVLETARFSQYTRVYSGDIHYLDHPKLGMIIQIRKYNH